MKNRGGGKVYAGLLTVVLAMPTALVAQVIIQQGVVALNTPASQVSVHTTLTNHGSLMHEGTLGVQGDLYNYADYQASVGTLVLEGSDQRIVSTPLMLGGLHVRKGGIKTVEGTFEVQNNLTLEKGLLSVPGQSKLILQEQASVRMGGPESYVQGYLYHRGTGEKMFPVGDKYEYAPVLLHRIQGETPVVGIRYDPSPSQPYWNQHLLQGTYLGAAATLSFQSSNADYLYYQDQLEVLGLPGKDQTRTPLGVAFLKENDSRITITSREMTAMPWLTVGFAMDPSLERVFVPNAFSPEASHPDDQCIRVYGNFISFQNFQFGIQDAWGRWVYQTASLEEAMMEGWPAASVASSSPWFRYILVGKFLSGTTFRYSDVIMKF